MVVFWKVILTILILYTVAIGGSRARRRRRQAPMPNQNPAMNSIQQSPMGPNPQILNGPGQPPLQQGGPNDIGTGKQGGRQYYSPYQGQYGSYGGYGSVQGLNYPYGGAGVGSYQYGSGYGGYGQGQGMGYGSYNPYYGSNSFYSGYGGSGYGSSYNRPSYSGYSGSSNYYPSGGSNYGSNYGGYYWNAGQKQNLNMFTVFLSSLLTLVICLITV